MITNFACKRTKELYEKGTSRMFASIDKVALRKLDMLNSANTIDDLRIPPANRLELLQGNRKGQHSIRINDQYRICFVWVNNKAESVEIVDYHK